MTASKGRKESERVWLVDKGLPRGGQRGATIEKQHEANTKIWEANEDLEKARSPVNEALKRNAASDREVSEGNEKIETLEQNAMVAEQLRDAPLLDHLMTKAVEEGKSSCGSRKKNWTR